MKRQKNQDLHETEAMDVHRLTERRKEMIEEAKLNIKEAKKNKRKRMIENMLGQKVFKLE